MPPPLLSLILTYKNPLLHALLSLTLTFLLTLLNFPVRLLEGLHTYILPETPTNSSSIRAAIRRPTDDPTTKKKPKSKQFEFDENNAQIFRLQLGHEHLRTRMFYKEYQEFLIFFLVSGSNILLHNFLPKPNVEGLWFNGSLIPIILGFIAVSRGLVSISKVSVERSASKRSEKQLSVLFWVLGFCIVFFIVLGVFDSVFDFRFDGVDGFGKVWIAVLGGCISGVLFMPAVKCARTFWLGTDQLRWNVSIIPCGGLGRGLLYANLLSNVFASLLWVNPLVEIFIKQGNVDNSNAILNGRIRVNENLIGNVGMDRSDFLKLRVWCLMGSGILQFLTLRPNLQMFLNEAVLSWYQRLHASKVPDLDFSRAKIFLYNYYLCLTVVQFLVPAGLALLFLGLSQIEDRCFSSNGFFIARGQFSWRLCCLLSMWKYFGQFWARFSWMYLPMVGFVDEICQRIHYGSSILFDKLLI